MTLHQVAVYHNSAARFLSYRSEHPLTLVFTFARDLPDDTTADQVADWTFRTFNVDLEDLEGDRTTPGAETAFLPACIYRLLRLRSLSTGDVVAVTTAARTTWLSCEPFGWRRIDAPATVSGQPLTTETVRQYLRRGHDA